MVMSDSDVIDSRQYLIKPYFDFSFYHVSSYRNSERWGDTCEEGGGETKLQLKSHMQGHEAPWGMGWSSLRVQGQSSVRAPAGT